MRLLGTIFLLVAVCPLLIASKGAQKSVQAQVKAMLKDAKRLEKSGHLLEARKEYTQSQALFDTKEAQKGLERVNDKLYDQVKKDLAQAAKQYNAGQFPEATKTVEVALALETATPLVEHDLALCYFRQGDPAKAADTLGQTIAATPDPKVREKLMELKSVMSTGETVALLTKDKSQRLAQFNAATFKLGTGATLDDPEPDDPPDDPADPPDPPSLPNTRTARMRPCLTLEGLKNDLAASASGVFNLANCAETNSRQEEATKLLDRYLALAPKALDREEVAARRAEIQILISLEGPHGTEVRKLFASATKEMQERSYGRALADYQKADSLIPDFALAKWKLGLLYEAMGSTPEACKYFTAYQTLSRDPNDPHPAQLHLESLDARRAKYDSEVSAASKVLSDLLYRGLNLDFNEDKHYRPVRAEVQSTKKNKSQGKINKEVGGFAVPFAYAQQQLGQAAQHLALAVSLFPLGAEANELMGFIYLQANDGAAAMRCFDAVAGQGLPVSFYAEMRGHKADHAAKCELSSQGARLIFLSSYDKRGRPKPPAIPAGKDGYGDMIVAPADQRAAQFDALTLTAANIAHVETKNGLVRLKFTEEGKLQEITLAPIFLPTLTPIDGPPARRFANTYTRLFMRYPGLEDSKLGAEGLTGIEKVKLGFQITQAAMNIGMSFAMGPVGAMNAIQGTQEAISIARTLSQTMASLHVNFATWETLVSEQQNMLVGVPFKVIPTTPPDLGFVLR